MIRGISAFACVLAWAAWAPTAAAHPSLSAYVQHDVSLEAGATYIDLTIQLTFFDRNAESQVALLDCDGDGRWSSTELGAFRNEILKMAEAQVTLRAGDRSLELLPLYDPEIKTSSRDANGEGHTSFEVRLDLFARLPYGLRTGDTLEVRDELYLDLPAISGFHVAGEDGVSLTTESDGNELSRSLDSKHPLTLRARLKAFPPKTNESTPPGPLNDGEKR